MTVSARAWLCGVAIVGLALAVSPVAEGHRGPLPVAAADGSSGGCGGASKDGGKAEPAGAET